MILNLNVDVAAQDGSKLFEPDDSLFISEIVNNFEYGFSVIQLFLFTRNE